MSLGGSSGGTAAAVAVLGAPVGITADIGGSTRIPAHFSGLSGISRIRFIPFFGSDTLVLECVVCVVVVSYLATIRIEGSLNSTL